MLTLQEAAQKAGVSEKTLRRAIGSGKLVAHQRETGGTHNNQPFMIDEQNLERYMESRQPTATTDVVDHLGLASRLTELEQAIKATQDLLSQEVAYSYPLQRRITSLEDVVFTALEVTIARMQEQAEIDHKLAYARIDALEERIRLVEIDTKSPEQIDQEIEDMFARNPGMQAMVEREKERLDEGPQAFPREWVITGNGRIDYHDRDETRTRQRLASLQANYRATRWELHPPEPTGQSIQSTDDAAFTLADFTQLDQHEYRSSATRGDVKAWLTLRPTPHGKPGDYSIDYFKYDKSDRGQKGAMSREQKARGSQLQTDLKTAVLKALGQAGWKEAMFGVYRHD